MCYSSLKFPVHICISFLLSKCYSKSFSSHIIASEVFIYLYKNKHTLICIHVLVRHTTLFFMSCLWSVASVMSDSFWPQPAELLCPWDSPYKSTGVGCHFLLQGIFSTQGVNPHLLYFLHYRQILYCWATREAKIAMYRFSILYPGRLYNHIKDKIRGTLFTT